MFDFWRRALLPLLALIVLSLLLWALAGPLPAALFFALSLLVRLVLYLRQLSHLDFWLAQPEVRVVPDGAGVWEEVCSRLNKMVRMQREEHRQRAAVLRYMEQATSALPEGVVILDEADRIEWCNPLAERHFGLDGERDRGQQMTYLARQPEFVQYLAMRNYNEPLVLRGIYHDVPTLSINLIPYGEDKKLLISSDITRFERIETMRRDFIANVSHELRTPLTVVNGFVETLHDMRNLDGEKAKRALKLMGEQTQRMQRLVDDLLMESEGETVFAKECLHKDGTEFLTIPESYERYVAFCNERGWSAMAKRKFSNAIGDTVTRLFGITVRHDLADRQSGKV